MIVHACLERDYCTLHGIETAARLTMMRRDFERYRDRFHIHPAIDVRPPPMRDDRPTRPRSNLACFAFVLCVVLSCIAVCSWRAWIK